MTEKLIQLLENKDYGELKAEFSEMNPADAASFMEEMFEERS